MNEDVIVKKRRETLRWRILQTLDVGRPYPLGEDTILAAVSGADMPTTKLDMRKEMDYLRDRGLIDIHGEGTHIWSASLTRHGVDVAEYTIECEAGIARPKKYW